MRQDSASAVLLATRGPWRTVTKRSLWPVALFQDSVGVGPQIQRHRGAKVWGSRDNYVERHPKSRKEPLQTVASGPLGREWCADSRWEPSALGCFKSLSRGQVTRLGSHRLARSRLGANANGETPAWDFMGSCSLRSFWRFSSLSSNGSPLKNLGKQRFHNQNGPVVGIVEAQFARASLWSYVQLRSHGRKKAGGGVWPAGYLS